MKRAAKRKLKAARRGGRRLRSQGSPDGNSSSSDSDSDANFSDDDDDDEDEDDLNNEIKNLVKMMNVLIVGKHLNFQLVQDL